MRYTAEHKEATHARILAAAERLFRKEGFGGASVERVMRAAGLTVGGFYAHFASKDGLLAESLRAFMDRSRASWLAGLDGLEGTAFLDQFARRYLTRHNLGLKEGTGCMMPSLLSDLTRATPEVQAAFNQGLEALADAGKAHLTAREGVTPRQQMLSAVALCFGAMTLARATGSQALSAELLEAARAVLAAGPPVEVTEEGSARHARPGQDAEEGRAAPVGRRGTAPERPVRKKPSH